MGTRDRITLPDALGPAAGDGAAEFPETDSAIRPVVSLASVPWLVVTYEQLRRFPLDSRAGFIVSLLDGRCTVEMLLDLSGMPEDETLAILQELVRLGVVELMGQ